LSPPININQIKPSVHLWRCPHCKFCEACNGTDQEDKLIVCDSCDRCYHMFCLNPPLEELPQGGWRCSECNHCIHCGSKTSSSAALLCDACGGSYSNAVLKLKDYVSGPESPFRFPRVKMTITPLRKQRPIVMERLAGAQNFEQWVPPSTSSSSPANQSLFSDMSPEQSVPMEILNAAPVISITELSLDLAAERASMVSRHCYFTFADAAFLLLDKVRRPMSPAVLTALALENALTRTRGSNPQTTMQANITAETKLETPRFKRIGRGLVALTEYGTGCAPPLPTIKEQSPPGANQFIQSFPVKEIESSSTVSIATTEHANPVPSAVPTATVEHLDAIAADDSKPQVHDEESIGYSPSAVTSAVKVEALSGAIQMHQPPPVAPISYAPGRPHIQAAAAKPAKVPTPKKPQVTPKKKRPRPEPVVHEPVAPPKPRRRKRKLDEDDPLIDVFTLLSALAPYNPTLRDVLNRLPSISAELLDASLNAKSIPPPQSPPSRSTSAQPPDLHSSISNLEAEGLDSLVALATGEEPAAAAALGVHSEANFQHVPETQPAAPSLAAGVTSAVVLGSPAVVLASGQTSPHLLWKTRGRPRKDGLPKISKLQLAYIAQKCDLLPQALMQHISDATKLRLKANPIQPIEPDESLIMEDRPRKKLKKEIDLAEEAAPADRVLFSSTSGGNAAINSDAPGFIVTAPLPKKKRRPKTKVTNINMYDKSAFTSDFGLVDDAPRRRKKYRPVEPTMDKRTQRRSAREAATGMAAVLESESALFVDRESRKAYKVKKPKVPPPPVSTLPDVGHVWQLNEMLLMCTSLDSGIPLLALLSEDFDLYSLSSVYEIELLRRSELVAPQMRRYLQHVQATHGTPVNVYSPISRDNLEEWDRIDPLGTAGNRRCYLCGDCGDNILRGRLILFDMDLWMHVNCISWSFEVFETDSGDLINVSKALERGRTTKCKVCNTLGATLNCKVTRCPCSFHFTCAIRANAKFIPTEHTLMCETHAHGKSVSQIAKKDPLREVSVTTFETPYWALLPVRRVSVDPEAPRRKPSGRSAGPLFGLDNKTRSLLLETDPKAIIRLQQHRVGSLTVKNLGRIVWEYPSFHTSSLIVPGDFFSARKFWSWRGTETSRSIYHLEVVVSDTHKRPLFRVVCVDDPDPTSVIQAWSAEDAWRAVVDKVNLFRQSLQPTPINPVRACLAGDIYFGFGCPTVMKYVERLPNLSLLTGAPVEPYLPQHALTLRFSSLMIRSVVFKGTPDVPLDIPENPSGCARSEPFSRLNARDKFSRGEQFGWHPASLVFKTPLIKSSDDMYVRETDAIAIAQRYQKMKETEYSRLRVMRSRIHEWGVFALEPIKAGEFMLEYVGELIRPPVSDAREKFYDSRGFGTYMFRLDEHYIVDATLRGNMARFVNHCCEPNSATDVFEVQGKKHIIIYSRRDIRKGEELTYDYMFNLEDDSKKIPCHCGARHCRGWMN
jgi:hypothetical protein